MDKQGARGGGTAAAPLRVQHDVPRCTQAQRELLWQEIERRLYEIFARVRQP